MAFFKTSRFVGTDDDGKKLYTFVDDDSPMPLVIGDMIVKDNVTHILQIHFHSLIVIDGFVYIILDDDDWPNQSDLSGVQHIYGPNISIDDDGDLWIHINFTNHVAYVTDDEGDSIYNANRPGIIQNQSYKKNLVVKDSMLCWWTGFKYCTSEGKFFDVDDDHEDLIVSEYPCCRTSGRFSYDGTYLPDGQAIIDEEILHPKKSDDGIDWIKSMSEGE